MIRLIDLTRRDLKSNRLLLDRVNMSIAAGERIGLVGPSGCGKSTLLRAIARLDRCDAGEVLFEGTTVCKDAVPAYRRRVIYLTQRPAFAAGSVRDNLRIPFRLAVSDAAYDEARVMRWLEKLSKPRELLDQSARSLSGGEQQIVSLIRAISLDPQVLLLDEPTASLDPESTLRFEQLARAWFDGRSVGPTWVWTSHDASQVGRMTSRIVSMRDGRLDREKIDE